MDSLINETRDYPESHSQVLYARQLADVALYSKHYSRNHEEIAALRRRYPDNMEVARNLVKICLVHKADYPFVGHKYFFSKLIEAGKVNDSSLQDAELSFKLSVSLLRNFNHFLNKQAEDSALHTLLGT